MLKNSFFLVIMEMHIRMIKLVMIWIYFNIWLMLCYKRYRRLAERQKFFWETIWHYVLNTFNIPVVKE